MHTINVNNYEELDDICEVLANVTKDKFEVAMYLLNNLGAVIAKKRISWEGFTTEEVPDSLVDYEVLHANLTWDKVIHDFKDQRVSGKHYLVFESDPTTMYEYDRTLVGSPKIYDIQQVQIPIAESIANVGKRTQPSVPLKDDWIIEPVPEPSSKKKGK